MPDSTARPGHHVTIGPEKAMEARRAGMQLRDTLLVLEPGPRVRLVMLFRAPLDGTLARNVLSHGEGGLNIDGCRIQTPEGSPSVARREIARRTGTVPVTGLTSTESTSMGRMERRGSGEAFKTDKIGEHFGRWPPNVLLVHGPGCTCKGTKQVRGCNPVSPEGAVTPKAYANRRSVYSAISDHPVTSHVDAEGMEAVPAWECPEGCAVRHLDAMSGESTSREGLPRSGRNGPGWGMTHTGAEYSDKGGASRFYPQFASSAGADQWIARLMGRAV